MTINQPTMEALAGDNGVHPVERRSAWPAAILFFLLTLVMNVPYLGMTPLAGTEGHRALTGHEMARSGQWLLPMLYGRPYLAKPPLHYWIIALSETIARHGNEFVWRFPSAVEGGMLCAIVCLFGARWFGRTAGIISGACALGMIALWGERQVTDIDVTNTLCATIAGLCGIEVLFKSACARLAAPLAGRGLLFPTTALNAPQAGPLNRSSTPRRFLYVLGAGLGLAGVLMTKGPAGLPIIASLWIYAAITTGAARRVSFWLPLLIGFGLFGGYFAAAHHFIATHGLPVDKSGVNEGLQSLYPKTLRQVGTALMLPGYEFAYALPVSAVLPLWFFLPQVRARLDQVQRNRAAAMAVAVPIAWAICMASGMVNPRYAYPTLPLLCPLAGAVAVTAVRIARATLPLAVSQSVVPALPSAKPQAQGWSAGSMTDTGTSRLDYSGPEARQAVRAAECIRAIAAVSAVALAGTALFLTRSAWTLGREKPVLVVCGIAASVTSLLAILVVLRITRSWRVAGLLIPMTVLVSVPFGFRQSLARDPVSGIHTARYINRIAGEHPSIVEGMALTFKPEIFYYAQSRTTALIPNSYDRAHVPPGTWLYMDNHEHDRWKREAGDLLNHDMLINLGGESTYYFAWYGPKDDPATRLADGAPEIAPTARGRK